MDDMMKKLLTLATFVTCFAGAAMAADKSSGDPAQFIWEPVPNVNSANIARTTDWELNNSSSVAWPDGRIALITYWRESKQHLTMRCVDFKNKEFQDTGAFCSQPAVLKSGQ